MIHSTPLNGIRYKYSNKKNDGDHFDIPKIIFGETGINKNLVIDINGTYGLTASSFGIEIYDIDIVQNIKKALLSNEFQNIIKSCSWGNYRIDWRLFTYFKKDFWKEFIVKTI